MNREGTVTLAESSPDPPSRFWPTALLRLWAINRGVSRPWLSLNTFGDLVSTLESTWEPSNSLVLARVQIDCE